MGWFFCALTWFMFSFTYLQQVSAFALSIESHNPPILLTHNPDSSRGNVGGGNRLTVGQVVTHLLRQLAARSDVRFRNAQLSAVFLRVSPGDQPSNNIADFRSIGCIFLYGGDAPPAGKSNAFTIVNQWPEQWDDWKNQVVPRSIPAALEEIPWQKTQALMSVEKAGYLLKAAGYVQRYRGVVMLKLADRSLGYCFSQVDGLRNLNVDVWTGRISEVRDCSVNL
ncbi:MAG: hypothetical protein L6R38_003831 [Xanthoria sp. 2 TBL-2021]|nr:MAG: hypothetical protein L6R38_003831 [Xanthoria sp. 2 TBL-2021]